MDKELKKQAQTLLDMEIPAHLKIIFEEHNRVIKLLVEAQAAEPPVVFQRKNSLGPWKWISDNLLVSENSHDHVLSANDDGKPFGQHNPLIEHHYDEEISRANKKLIEAAPLLLDALQDMLNGWRYIRETHGDLYGVGWDRCENSASIAIERATES